MKKLSLALAAVAAFAITACAEPSKDWICIKGDYEDVKLASRIESMAAGVRYEYTDNNGIEQTIGSENSGKWYCKPALEHSEGE